LTRGRLAIGVPAWITVRLGSIARALMGVTISWKRTLVAGVAALGLLAPASVADAATFVARLKASGHNPKAGKRWPIRVSASTRSGKPVRATAYYQFLFGGQVISTQYPSPRSRPGACPGGSGCRRSPYAFRGSFRDPTIIWPRRAVGYRLTFRVVVKGRGRGTKKLNYAVRVRR
jgi:hypothetical protein